MDWPTNTVLPPHANVRLFYLLQKIFKIPECLAVSAFATSIRFICYFNLNISIYLRNTAKIKAAEKKNNIPLMIIDYYGYTE